MGQGVHDGAQLPGADGPVPVLVEEVEGLLELGDLLLGQLVGHGAPSAGWMWAEGEGRGLRTPAAWRLAETHLLDLQDC